MEYQHIEFGNVKIEGKDRYPEYKLVFPEKPADKTILDIGCNLGYYCFQAHFDGAKYCIGIDNHIAFIETANDIQKMLNIDNVYFSKMDILAGRCSPKMFPFDIVLMLYVFHHFTDINDIYDVVRKCYKIANEMVVFGVLNPNKGNVSEILINRKGNEKIALSKDFFINLYPDDKIESIPSAINADRSLIKIYKEKKNV